MRKILMAALAALSIGGFAGSANSGVASKASVHGLRPDTVQQVQDRWSDCRDWDRDGRRCRDRDWDDRRWRDWFGADSCRGRGHERYLEDGHWRMCVRDEWRDCRDWDRDGRRCRDRDWDDRRWRDYDGRDSCRRRGHDRYFEDGRWLRCAMERLEYRDCRDWDRRGRMCRDRDWDDNRWRDYYGPRSCRLPGHERYYMDGRWYRCQGWY
jgi:hypothetical protein